MTDYEKAKAECWREYQAKGDVYPTARETFDFTFEHAYRYGRMVGMEEAKANPYKPDHPVEKNEMVRTQAAIAAMQGILANAHPKIVDKPFDQIPKIAVFMADLLLKELDDTKAR